MPNYNRRRIEAIRKNIDAIKNQKKIANKVDKDSIEIESVIQKDEYIKEHKYWNNKPVIGYESIPLLSRKIEDLSLRQVYTQDNTLKIPNGFSWITLDLNNKDTSKLVEKFLEDNYLIDVSDKFILKYTGDFINWAFGNNSLFIGITDNNGELCGTIGCRIRNIVVFDKIEKMADTNFLCVRKNLRNKGMPMVLIDEMTRRLNKIGVSVGIFTTGRQIPSPTTTIRYFHRPLNYEKLTNSGFIKLKDLDSTTGQNFFDPKQTNDKIRVVKTEDYEIIYELYIKEMTNYNIYIKYTLEEFISFFFNNEYMKTFVLMNKEDMVCDFFSFYLLPYLVKDTNEKIEVGYLYTNTTNNYDIDEILDNFIYHGYDMKLDLLNIMDIMQIRKALLINEKKDIDSDDENTKKPFQHKFLKGTGKLYLNFFNWEVPRIMPGQLAIMPI